MPVTDPDTLDRIRALGIPPAWKDVWICADDRGHLQAVGTDAAGRKQYLYHEQWRLHRDREKFDLMLEFAAALPDLRDQCARDLAATESLTRDRVLACAVRLLDRGFFRIGSEQYAESNETYGLATLLKRHVREEGPYLVFDYSAKHGKRRIQRIIDEDVRDVIVELKGRRGGGRELLAWRDGRSWVDVRSGDINAYIKDAIGEQYSAKDFRTWHATVLCAIALAVSDASAAARGTRRPPGATTGKRVIAHAVKEASHYLGNTPAVCRASYIDPRVFDRYLAGVTIAPVITELSGLTDFEQPELQRVIEVAVLELLGGSGIRRITNVAEREMERLAS